MLQILSVHSPALLDLDHGTIRHRNVTRKQGDVELSTKTKTGYFYHPKLDDYSEGINLLRLLSYQFNQFTDK